MDLNINTMDALFTALNGSLNKGIAQAWNGWQKFAMIVNSNAAVERYPVMLVQGSMREWVGSRTVHTLNGKTLDVRNRDYEHTEGVSRNDIEDDTIGLYSPLFEAMGVNAANLWGKLATEALCNPGNWADGAAFYKADRQFGKATVNNTVSGALSLETYEAARTQMLSFCDASGSPLGLVPDLLVVGPALEGTAKQILKAELTVSGNTAVSNIHKDEAEIIIDPFMVGEHADKWFLICTTRGIRPVAVQKRKEGALVRWDNDSDICVKEHNRNDYGLHYRGAAAAVGPHLVIGGNL